MSEEQPIHYWDRWTAYTPCGQLPRSMWAKHTTDDPEKVTCPKCKEKMKNVKHN